MAVVFKPIKLGAKGKAVSDIQKLLQKAGSTIKVNGEFGIGMLSAVKSFQKKNGLKVTGVVDKKTLDKLATFKKKK